MSDVGGSTDVTNIALTLDDEATNGFLPNDTQLTTGRFRPANYNLNGSDNFPAPAPADEDSSASLDRFDGQKANGGWDLFVVDDSGADCGSNHGWGVTITARS